MRLHPTFLSFATVAVVLSTAGAAYAAHSWGNYHWARTENPFTLKLGDNVSSTWDSYLAETSSDWSLSSVLDTLIVSGGGRKNCRATAGRIEVCNAKYGKNGWLGLAQVWVNGNGHITQGTAKMNDTYFSTAAYNSPAWRRLVMCQEVAHGFGLDHQDEAFNNPNVGSCMDYTSDPDGPPSNEHPNAHDYEQLELIYAHLDAGTTLSASAPQGTGDDVDVSEPRHWGKALRKDGKGRDAHFVQDLAKGHKVFTFVIWAD